MLSLLEVFLTATVRLNVNTIIGETDKNTSVNFHPVTRA